MIPNPFCFHCCANWGSASCPTHLWDTDYSPARFETVDDFADDDWHKGNPRFTGENFWHNLQTADEVQSIATEIDATAAQVALAWLLLQGNDIAPIPGTKRLSRVEENTAADAVSLNADQIDRLNNLTPAAGARHDESNMATIDR